MARIEILAPVGSEEMLRAAVFSGADAVYLGFSGFNARTGAGNFDADSLQEAVRFCHARGVAVHVALNTTVYGTELPALEQAIRAVAASGADAVICQDLAVATLIGKIAPQLPRHGSTQMSVHTLQGALELKELGFTRVVLARELSLPEVEHITKHCGIETECFVHGALCMCVSGQCYMSAFLGGRSGNRGLCAQPCRMEYTMGGRLEDSHPLSLKDNCLVDRLREIEDAGVACAKIEGRMKRPEYTGIVTGIYSRIIKERREPTADELQALADAFSRQGFTQGYFNGDKTDMFGVRAETDKTGEKMFADVRREYIGREERRVPVKFYAVVNAGEAVKAAAVDNLGNKAVAFGAEPQKAIRQAISSEVLSDRLGKTGGTPYYCIDAQSRVQSGLYLSASEINELRRKLITALNDRRAAAPQRRSLPMPPMPSGQGAVTDPVMIYQVRTAEQLTEELADTRPDYIYIPVKVMHDSFDLIQMFRERGTVPVAVLPRVVTDSETKQVFTMLRGLFDRGINEALVGNLGHIKLARRAGMKTRADFGMNVFNSYSMDMIQRMGFLSATASFELRLAQVRDMAKCVPTELIAYGRLPLMVSDQCVISHSLGTCSCQSPAQLSDRMGSTFPVVREFDHRNVIYNSRKLFMADKNDELCGAGLWGIRLMFTTEGARECVQVARRYKGEGDYQPNDLTRGLYYRGVD